MFDTQLFPIPSSVETGRLVFPLRLVACVRARLQVSTQEQPVEELRLRNLGRQKGDCSHGTWSYVKGTIDVRALRPLVCWQKCRAVQRHFGNALLLQLFRC